MSRADAERNRERILEAAEQLLAQSPDASLSDIAAAAGLSRSTLHRHFRTREDLVEACSDRPVPEPAEVEQSLPAGQLGRKGPVAVEAIHAFDVVAAPVLPEQLVAEAQRIANIALALYVVDIDGTHLLRVAGSDRLPAKIKAPLAVGPELDRDGLAALRQGLKRFPGAEVIPLWLRGRATGAMITVGPPRGPLSELARQAAVAITLADRYTDVFARATRRKRPSAAAEIQQSLLPPRIARLTGAEVAGNVLPSYEVAGDWFDVIENPDGIWVSLADGLGGSTRAAASSAVAMGALRASRRSGGTPSDALLLMHATLKEMPGPRAEMSALVAHWDPIVEELQVVNCGHVPPVILRADGEAERLPLSTGRGLGGRAAPRPTESRARLSEGDRLILFSDGVVAEGEGKAGLGFDGLVEAALGSTSGAAPDTVRHIHMAVLDASGGDLSDDATAVCLTVG
jgi:serine phosphatase RsbU (regulator of sigma subunit)